MEIKEKKKEIAEVMIWDDSEPWGELFILCVICLHTLYNTYNKQIYNK